MTEIAAKRVWVGVAVLALIATMGALLAESVLAQQPEPAPIRGDVVYPIVEPACDEGSDLISCMSRNPVRAKNGEDISYLQNRPGGPPADDNPIICDRTKNGRKATVKAFFNPTDDSGFDGFRDRDGAGGDCWGLNLGYNSSAHSTGKGYWDGRYHGHGRRDPHGG